MEIEEYVEKLDAPLKEIVSKLREIVTNHSSDIKEEMKWNVPTYSITRNICSIMAHKKHVNFQIFRGAHIKDSQNLEGTGKDMRHLKFHTVEEIEESRVKKILEQAIRLDQ